MQTNAIHIGLNVVSMYMEPLGDGVRISASFCVPTSPVASKDSSFKALGPKDPIKKGSWAILMLRVMEFNAEPQNQF